MDITREYAFGVIPFYRQSLDEYRFFIGLTPGRGGSKQFWKFPKGHKDHEEEDDVDAALRELYEETGIELSESALIKSISFEEQYFFEKGNVVVRKLNRYFLGQVDYELRQNVEIDHKEFVEYRWASFEEVLELLPDNSKPMIVEANNFLVRHRV